MRFTPEIHREKLFNQSLMLAARHFSRYAPAAYAGR